MNSPNKTLLSSSTHSPKMATIAMLLLATAIGCTQSETEKCVNYVLDGMKRMVPETPNWQVNLKNKMGPTATLYYRSGAETNVTDFSEPDCKIPECGHIAAQTPAHIQAITQSIRFDRDSFSARSGSSRGISCSKTDNGFNCEGFETTADVIKNDGYGRSVNYKTSCFTETLSRGEGHEIRARLREETRRALRATGLQK